MFDYLKISGVFWNKLDLNIQIEILSEHYPIGSRMHFKHPSDNRVSDGTINDYYKEYSCIIKGYELICRDESKWYILKIENDNQKTFNMRHKVKYEDIHPGFFLPTIDFLRDKKLKSIGINER